MRFAIQPFAAFKFLAVMLALVGVGGKTLRADVVPIGDVSPATDPDEDPEDPPSDDLVTDLPQFGGEVDDIIIVGGTNFFVGDTSTGQLTIDIPSETDPLISPGGIIGGSALGLGQTRILGLNSEWRSTEWMIVGYQGQGFLDVTAGGRMQVVKEDGVAGIEDPAITTQSPWEEYDLVFGAFEGSQGFAEIDGFASLVYSGNITVGFRGQGHIDMVNGSRMITRNVATIGTRSVVVSSDAAVGDGYVLVDGAGTRWTIGLERTTGSPIPPLPGGGGGSVEEDTLAGRLFVGQQGRGTLEVRNQGWVRVETTTRMGAEANSYGRLSVDGTDSLFWTLDDLFVGNTAGTAAGELQISGYGQVRADGTGTTGGVTVGELGVIDFASNGQLVTPEVANAGVIRGDGRVQATLVTNTGDLRNGASLANLRERLVFTGVVNNTSNVESVGGEMEFQGDFNHTGADADLVGIDAIFRFRGNLNVTGDARVFLENTLVWVPAGSTFSSNGVLSLWEGQSTLAGDLALGAGNELNIVLGEPSFGRLEVIGDASLGGRAFVSLADDYLPQIGDSFEIIDAESLSGTFTTVGGGGSGAGFWQATYTGNSAILSYMGDIISTLLADFDGNGVVDGGDLAVLESNYGKTPATMGDGDANGDGVVDGSDFLIWQQELGSTAVVAAGAPASGTVPEPSGFALAAVALGALARRRTGSKAAGRGRRAA
jgi:T5SS/PEP-CTERM-associated repeat protein